jgi:hypothetical protein
LQRLRNETSVIGCRLQLTDLVSRIAKDEGNAFFRRLGREGRGGKKNQRTKGEGACEKFPHGVTKIMIPMQTSSP